MIGFRALNMNVYKVLFALFLLAFCGKVSTQRSNRRRPNSRWIFRYQDSSCRDVVSNCNTLRSYQWCYSYRNYMMKNCRQTCGWCSTVTSTCIDRHQNCWSWARQGACRRNWQYMMTNCARSCGHCKQVQVVNGNWGSWSVFSRCSVSCGGGIKARYRQCNNPAPKNGGRTCPGGPKQTRTCNTQRCMKVVDGNWGSWSVFSRCSVSCGGGIQARYRQCTNPAPTNGGRTCPGGPKQTRTCNTQKCNKAVDGNWGAWGPYSSCSKTCGDGRKTKTRQCNNPAPQHGGKTCLGVSRHTIACNLGDCVQVIDGQWGSWSVTSCSVTCGSGVQTRLRRCDSPPPKNGGKTCVGKSREQTVCTLTSCPKVIDGKWSAWGRWSTCTRTCNGGFKTRYRNCDNPAPSIDGQYCKGDEAEKISCNTRRCKAKIPLPPFTCGKSTLSRIVGGSLGKTTDWPWQAGLKRGNDDKIFCGGSIINREWVITAAHCIYRLEPSRTGCVAPEPRLRVILGEFDVDNVEGHEVTRDVAQVCMHPKYQHRTLDYDIALLRLARPIMKFNEHIKPVCMPSSSYVIPIGKNCTVTGFGRLAEDADLSSKLRQASVPIKPLDYCKTQYPLHLVNDRMICAGYEGGQIDACKGDSGGPFVCKDGYNYVLAGAVSWGVGCAKAGQPGLYANIRYFLSWIQTTMKKT